MSEKISIVIPCYNEESMINLFYKEMSKVIKSSLNEYSIEYIFIDDGSRDGSLDILKDLDSKITNVHYISFSRNFGKEAALYAGLEYATGDYIVVMDVDLQDPPILLPKMVKILKEENFDCVGTRRTTRMGEPPIRSFFARQFYKIINQPE